MPKHRSTDFDKCMIAAQRTIDLVDNQHTPDDLNDAILERLIEMSDESRMQIWNGKTGLHLETLAALFTLYKRGAGYRRVRIYGRYETSRLERERQERIDKERQKNEQS